MAETKQIAVNFPTGKDVLNAYWGFLSNGGLVIRDPADLEEGDPVSIEVTIESSNARYLLNGHVVRRPHIDPTAGSAVIAFAPGEPQDLLLSAAWAETDNVPARRHRRHPVSAFTQVRLNGSLHDARMVNVSGGGFCVRILGAHDHVEVGTTLNLCFDGREYAGTVRWCVGADFGVELTGVADDERELLVGRLIAASATVSSPPR